MSVTVGEILAAARVGAAALTSETVGYLVLAAADRLIQASPASFSIHDIEVDDRGAVTVRGVRPAEQDEVPSVLRSSLRDLLKHAPSGAPALVRVGSATEAGTTTRLIGEIEAALIPVNRAAARRALARLHRDVMRARDSGELLHSSALAKENPAAVLVEEQSIEIPGLGIEEQSIESPGLGIEEQSIEIPGLEIDDLRRIEVTELVPNCVVEERAPNDMAHAEREEPVLDAFAPNSVGTPVVALPPVDARGADPAPERVREPAQPAVAEPEACEPEATPFLGAWPVHSCVAPEHDTDPALPVVIDDVSDSRAPEIRHEVSEDTQILFISVVPEGGGPAAAAGGGEPPDEMASFVDSASKNEEPSSEDVPTETQLDAEPVEPTDAQLDTSALDGVPSEERLGQWGTPDLMGPNWTPVVAVEVLGVFGRDEETSVPLGEVVAEAVSAVSVEEAAEAGEEPPPDGGFVDAIFAISEPERSRLVAMRARGWIGSILLPVEPAAYAGEVVEPLLDGDAMTAVPFPIEAEALSSEQESFSEVIEGVVDTAGVDVTGEIVDVEADTPAVREAVQFLAPAADAAADAQVATETVTVARVPEVVVEALVTAEAAAEPPAMVEPAGEPSVTAEAAVEPPVMVEAAVEPSVMVEAAAEPPVMVEAAAEPNVTAETAAEPIATVDAEIAESIDAVECGEPSTSAVAEERWAEIDVMYEDDELRCDDATSAVVSFGGMPSEEDVVASMDAAADDMHDAVLEWMLCDEDYAPASAFSRPVVSDDDDGASAGAEEVLEEILGAPEDLGSIDWIRSENLAETPCEVPFPRYDPREAHIVRASLAPLWAPGLGLDEEALDAGWEMDERPRAAAAIEVESLESSAEPSEPSAATEGSAEASEARAAESLAESAPAPFEGEAESLGSEPHSDETLPTPEPATTTPPPPYQARQSDVTELLAGFSVAEARSLRELSRELKLIAGVAATPAPPVTALKPSGEGGS